MNWKLYWKVVRITFGFIILIAALIMLGFSLFAFEQVDIAYCMFSILLVILGIIMVLFGFATLPQRVDRS